MAKYLEEFLLIKIRISVRLQLMFVGSSVCSSLRCRVILCSIDEPIIKDGNLRPGMCIKDRRLCMCVSVLQQESIEAISIRTLSSP